MKKHLAPRLIPLDMSKAKEHELPGLDTKKTYLCLIGGTYFVGQFNRQWYGWFFDGWIQGTIGLQFDAPGWNRSSWQQIWELRKRQEKK